MEKTLEFSAAVLPAPSPYRTVSEISAIENVNFFMNVSK